MYETYVRMYFWFQKVAQQHVLGAVGNKDLVGNLHTYIGLYKENLYSAKNQ